MNTKPGHESERTIPTRERVRRPRRDILAGMPEVLEGRQLLSTDVWQGGNANFNDAANWSGNVVPSSGDTLVFSSTGTAHTTSLPDNFTAGGITVKSDFGLIGTLNVAGNVPLTVDPNATLTLAGTKVLGSGTLTKLGTGTLAFNTTNAQNSAGVTINAQVGQITLGTSGAIPATIKVGASAKLTEVNSLDGKTVNINGLTVSGESDGTAGNIEITPGNTFAPAIINNGFYKIDNGAVFSPSLINGGYFTQEGPNTLATNQALNAKFTLATGGTAAVQAANYGSTFTDGQPAGMSTPNDFVVNVVPNQGATGVFGSSVTGGGKFITSGLGNVVLANGIKEANGATETATLTNTGDIVLGAAQNTLATSIDIPNSSTLTLAQWSTLNLSGSSLTLDKAAVALNQNTALGLTINGLNAGTQYGQLISGGGINVNNATLAVTPTIAPPAGSTFTILKTTGLAQINGQFAGLTQGTVFSQGGINFQISYTSQAVTLTSLAQPSTTTIASPSGAIKPGDSVTLTAKVAGAVGSPTGTVTFMDGTTALGTAPVVKGVATLSGLGFTGGNHKLTASYSGDAGFTASTSAPLAQTVRPTNTGLVLYGTANGASVGQTVLVIATATSNLGSPTGQVTFFDGTTNLGNATLDSNGHAILPVTNFNVGTHQLTASYAGDANDTAATTAKPQALNITPVPTTVTLQTSPNPSVFGHPVGLNATVQPSIATKFELPTGQIAFAEGKTVLGVANVDATGHATLNVSNLPVGKNDLTANYTGDSHFAVGANVVATSETVVAAATNTSLTLSPNPPIVGRQMLFTANVVSTGGIPTGSVTFKNGGKLLGKIDLTGGQAFLVTTLNYTAGQTVTATYNGSPSFTDSTSNAVTLTPPTTVAPPPTVVPSTKPSTTPTPPVVVTTPTPVPSVHGHPLHGHKVHHPKPVKLVHHTVIKKHK